MTAPSREEYEIWQENAVTRFVMTGCQNIADRQRKAYGDAAWNGNMDPLYRQRCVTRAESFSELASLSYEDAVGANEVSA